MTSDPQQTYARSDMLRGVVWRDLFPWILLFQVPRVAASGPVLALGCVGLLGSLTVWSLLCGALASQGYGHVGFQAMCQRQTTMEGPSDLVPGGLAAAGPRSLLRDHLIGDRNPISYVTQRMVAPFWMLIRDRAQLSWSGIFLCVAGTAANAVIWSFLGTAICRICVAEIGAEQRIGTLDALLFSQRQWAESSMAVLIPLLGLGLLTLPQMVLGWLMRLDLGVFLAGCGWLICLAISFLSAVLVLGLLLGWPFLWAAMAAEAKDAFDAVSRSYSYAFQRPLQYMAYLLLSLLLGGVTWAIVLAVGELVVLMANWSTGWGAGDARMLAIHDAVSQGQASLILRGGMGLIGLANGMVLAITYGFAYGYFWSAVSAMYLLLRRDVDQLEVDEIFFTEQRAIPPWEQSTEETRATSSSTLADGPAAEPAHHDGDEAEPSEILGRPASGDDRLPDE